MSGDSEAPPTYYFNGITFNPDFYQTSSTFSSGDYLTPSTGNITSSGGSLMGAYQN